MRRIAVAIFLLPLSAFSQLHLAKVFSDNMVLQRDMPVHIHGKAIPGKKITVTFAGETRTAGVNPDSSWSIILAPKKVNARPQLLTVRSDDEKIVLQNILIGDVWLCIGQSNMEWPMIREMHFNEEIANSHQPLIRFYNPTYAGKNIFGTVFTDSVVQRLTPEKFYAGQWQQCDSNSIKTMSAVAYYFGKEVVQNINVPIGLINLAIGGAPLETFIDKEVLKKSSRFGAKVNGDWLDNDALPVWIRERGRQNIGSLQNVTTDENGRNHAYKPGFAYEAGIKSILPLPVKGILCYQGESNAQEMDRVKEYADLSKLMVDDFRKKCLPAGQEGNQTQLPFYYVQLSSIDTIKYKGHFWPAFRDEQRKMLQIISFSGMAVCSDMGARDDVHPTNKKDVGERLARWALNKTYGLDIVPSGPLPADARFENDRVTIRFQYVAGGLKTSDGNNLKGFSLDGITEVPAVFGDSGILIFTDKKPEFVYYGWKAFSEGNLVNSEDLPASTFKIKVQ